MRSFSLGAAIVAACVCTSAALGARAAQAPAAGRVGGRVASTDGSPVGGAVVSLSGHGAKRTATTDERGRFALDAVVTGTYALAVDARGYNRLAERALDVRANEAAVLSLVLERASGALATIGRVHSTDAQAISTSAVPSVVLDAQRYSARGYASVADVIAQNTISTTVVRPNGAAAGAPASVALRGPDPTETLVQIDGHAVNSGHTGSFDLSLLDPADVSAIQLVYGIAPTSLVGPNTIDGAIDVRTLEPTTRAHGMLRLAAGSFGTFAETLQSTGTAGSLGYAFSLHRATSAGEVRDATVGGALAASTALAKLHYDFAHGAGFVEAAVHDRSATRDLSAALTSLSPEGYEPSVGSALLAHAAAYTLDARVPLGAPRPDGVARASLMYSHASWLENQSVFGPAAGSSPYLFGDVDRSGDDSLQFDAALAQGTLSAKFELRSEALSTPQSAVRSVVEQAVRFRPLASERARLKTDAPAAPQPDSAAPLALTQTQRTVALRYAGEPSAKLHFALAAYYGSFSTFGTSFDPRASIVWTPSARSALRASLGSTFQAPQLTELYVPAVLPPPGADGYISIGNPHLRADRATGLDIGYERRIGRTGATLASLDAYRTNVRTPAQRYLPGATCTNALAGAATCLTYPINAGGAVYRGLEMRLERAFGPALVARAAYGISSAYLTSVSREFADGTLVPGEQTLGVPLHKALLSFEKHAPQGLSFEAGLTYEDRYNELNRPAFATLHAGLSTALRGFETNAFVDNLTNVYAERFTRLGAGIPYAGRAGPVPTDAYALPGRSVRVSLTHRF